MSQRFPASNSITVQIPQKEPYPVIFDGGPGHKVVKKRPEPPGGLTANSDAINLPTEPSDVTSILVPLSILVTMIAIAIILVFLIPKMKKPHRIHLKRDAMLILNPTFRFDKSKKPDVQKSLRQSSLVLFSWYPENRIKRTL